MHGRRSASFWPQRAWAVRRPLSRSCPYLIASRPNDMHYIRSGLGMSRAGRTCGLHIHRLSSRRCAKARTLRSCLARLALSFEPMRSVHACCCKAFRITQCTRNASVIFHAAVIGHSEVLRAGHFHHGARGCRLRASDSFTRAHASIGAWTPAPAAHAAGPRVSTAVLSARP